VRHVTAGHAVLSRQRALIQRLKSHGSDTSWFEEGLRLFERSQVIFEEDLERIRLECL
jgi:hypothetical protein